MGGTGRLIVRFHAVEMPSYPNQIEGPFDMKPGDAMDITARAGRAIQIAKMVITGLVVVSWVYFGTLYLIHDPGECTIAT
jgi:hypothetical protein